MIYLETITSIILIFLMSYLSCAKTAFIATNCKEIKKNLKENKKKLEKYKVVEQKQSLVIACIKSCMAFFSMWFSALVVEIVAMPMYRNMNIVWLRYEYTVKYLLILATVIIITYIMYIFVDTIPKAFAIKIKNKVVIFAIEDMYLLLKLLRPVNSLSSKTEEIIMNIFKIKKEQKIEYNDIEMKELVEMAKEGGSIDEGEEKILEGYIDLDLRKARDIMIDIEKVCMIDLNSSKEEIEKKILGSGYSRLPVCDGESRNIIGVLNTKKVLNSTLVKNTFNLDSVIKQCLYVPEGKRLDLLFSEMRKQKQHMAIVVKEKNIALGIITMEDIIEQFVGDIEDEKDQEKK